MQRSTVVAVGLTLCGTWGVACGDDASGDISSSSSGTTSSGNDDSSGAGTTSATTSSSGGSSSTAAADSSGSESSSSTGTPIGADCWDDLELGAVEVVFDGFDGSEGIAFTAEGTLVVTGDMDDVRALWTIDPEGTATNFAEVPTALGLAPRDDGSLVVASIGGLMDPDGAVYTVSSSGRVALLAEGIDSPNFVTIAPDGSALISDDFDTRVFRVDSAGTVSTIIEDVPSPNGMGYAPDDSAFYVASTFTSAGELTRYDVGDDGLPIEDTGVEILHTGSGSFNDGIAVGETGSVYVLANLSGEIWRVDGSATTLQDGEIVVDGLESPASIAFGVGPDHDPCSGYVTELMGSRVVRVVLGEGGAPLHG